MMNGGSNRPNANGGTPQTGVGGGGFGAGASGNPPQSMPRVSGAAQPPSMNSRPKMEQHKQTTSKPFQPIPYTEEEHDRIQNHLNKVLGPEYVSFRPGGGGQNVSYIEGWKALNLANEIFGFNGWCSEMISTQVDFFDTHGNTGRFSMGLSVVVRITIKDGTYHEDFGYGYIDHAKNKAMAFEKCKKEAFTDGLKRCLRCFGNVLGNCLYDKTIISKIQKVKLPPPELNGSDFHRDPLIVQRENMKHAATRVSIPDEGSLGPPKVPPVPQNPQNSESGLVSKANHTSAVPNVQNSASGNVHRQDNRSTGNTSHHVTDSSNRQQKQQPDTLKNYASTPSTVTRSDATAPGYNKNTEALAKAYDLADFDSFIFSDDMPGDEDMDGIDEYELNHIRHKNQHNGGFEESATMSKPSKPTNNHANSSNKAASTDTPSRSMLPSSDNLPSGPTNSEIPEQVSFVNAKSADLLRQAPEELANLPNYNPKFVAQSIRRTVDPNKSVPIRRSEASQPIRASQVPAPGSTTVPASRPRNAAGAPNTPIGSKRMIGLPPSQRPTSKRPHREIPNDDEQGAKNSGNLAQGTPGLHESESSSTRDATKTPTPET